MADIRDWGKLIRCRWDWTAGGYEDGFPRGCQFTDLDAVTEFNGRRLILEPKHYDGIGVLPGREGYPPGMARGQLDFLRNEATLGNTAVFVLYGCGPCNDPYVLYSLGATRGEDRREDWRGLDKEERRKLFKAEIDRALGLENG
jgi:hypothetical protein